MRDDIDDAETEVANDAGNNYGVISSMECEVVDNREDRSGVVNEKAEILQARYSAKMAKSEAIIVYIGLGDSVVQIPLSRTFPFHVMEDRTVSKYSAAKPAGLAQFGHDIVSLHSNKAA